MAVSSPVYALQILSGRHERMDNDEELRIGKIDLGGDEIHYTTTLSLKTGAAPGTQKASLSSAGLLTLSGGMTVSGMDVTTSSHTLSLSGQNATGGTGGYLGKLALDNSSGEALLASETMSALRIELTGHASDADGAVYYGLQVPAFTASGGSGMATGVHLGDGVDFVLGTDDDLAAYWDNSNAQTWIMSSSPIELVADDTPTPMGLATGDAFLTISARSGNANQGDSSALNVEIDNTGGTAVAIGPISAVRASVSPHSTDSENYYAFYCPTPGGNGNDKYGLKISTGWDYGIDVASGGITVSGGSLLLNAASQTHLISGSGSSLKLNDDLNLTFGADSDVTAKYDSTTDGLWIEGPSTNIIARVTAGATLTAGDAVYYASADGEVYKTDATDVGKLDMLGVMMESATDGQASKACAVYGVVPIVCNGAIDPGETVYLSNAAGRVDSAAGTNESIIGWAVSKTTAAGQTVKVALARS